MHTLSVEAAKYSALKEQLIATHQDLDEETLMDTLEGLSDLDDIIAGAIRSAIHDETLASSLKIRLHDLKVRLGRLQARAKAKRAACAAAMVRAELRSITKDDVTISLRKPADELEIFNPDRVPPEYWTTSAPVLSKRALSEALKSGIAVDGVRLTPASPSLTVRVK